MSIFEHVLVSNGIICGPLLLLDALVLASLAVLLSISLRRRAAASRNLLPRLAAAADGGGADLLAELTRGDRSFLGQAVAAGVARLPLGIEEARHAITSRL